MKTNHLLKEHITKSFVKFRYFLLLPVVFTIISLRAFATPVADAGNDTIIFLGQSVQIGSSPIEGYAYSWSPSFGLNDSTVANPIATPIIPTFYILTLTDESMQVTTDTVFVGLNIYIDGEFAPHQADTNDIILQYTPLVYDRFGNTYTFNDIKRGSCSPGWETAVNDAQAGIFNICMCHEPLSADPFIQDVQDVILQVFEDLSELIVAQGCGTNFPLVNIQINAPLGMDQGVAGAASEFYVPGEEVFSVANETSGIIYGRVWKAINTGVNSPTLVDGRIDLNFSNFNFNTNLAPNSTGIQEIDLYSVVLHEVFHCLGFASLISGNGLSRIGNTNFYSKFDTYLHSDFDNENLIDWDGLYDAEYNSFFSGSPAVLNDPVPCQNILFEGLYANGEPIAGFPQGALSHFSCAATNANHMMQAAIVFGEERRLPRNADVNVLLDLGYEITGTFPNTTGLPDGGPSAIGRLDGITVATEDCAPRFTLTLCDPGNDDITITEAQILNNDINSDEYDGLEILTTNGSFIDNGTSFTYEPATPGFTVFRYIPVNSTTGERGNITYIYIEVFPCLNNCHEPDVCNQICNPDFDCPGTCNEFNISPPPSWATSHGTSDWQNNAVNQPNPGYARMAAINNVNCNGTWSEGILTNVNINQGQNYTISYFRRRGDLNGSHPVQLFTRLINQNNDIPNLATYCLPNPLPTNQLIVQENGITDLGWEQVVVCFTADDDYEFLWIYPQILAANNNGSVYIDRIQIIEDTYSAGDDDIITCGNVTLGTTSCGVDNVTYRWTVQGSQDVIGDEQQILVNVNETTTFTVFREYSENPATVVFPTQADNCNLEDDITITVTDPLSLTLAHDDLNCFGDCDATASVTNIANGTSPFFYQWDGPGSQVTATATDLCAGTYNVTVTDNNGCTVTDDVTINETSQLLLTPVITNVCNGGSLGAIDLSVSGGTSPYTYNWSNSATTQDINNLTAGIYHVTVTDDNGCTTSETSIIVSTVVELLASVTHICDGITTEGAIDLQVSGTGESPYIFSWSNSATTEDISGLTADTYNVTVTDDNGCSTTLSSDISIIDCVCSPSSDEDITYFNWTNSFALTSNTIYALNANATVTGTNVVLTDAVIHIAPNISITIANGATLTLDHSHLYACDELWQGIIVEDGGRLIINNNTLIEDANIAVAIMNNTSTSSILDINGVIFNKNYVAIYISDYQQQTAPYPFEIHDAIFTSRNIPFPSSSWPFVSTLKTLVSGDELGEHYEMGSYTTTGLKPPLNGLFPIAGIYINEVGTYNSGYYDITIDGDNGNTSFNLFDQLAFGIYAENSNFTVKNNVFQFINKQLFFSSYIGGYGIAAENQDIGSLKFSITVEEDNRFYDCVTGIGIVGYNEINISQTDMRSTQMPVTSIPEEGEMGISIETPYLDEMNITENTITNIRNGIVFMADIDYSAPTNEGQQIGPVTISENIIQATLDGISGTPTDEYVLNGIIADNTLYYGLPTNYPCPITIENNNLYQVHNGIHTQGWYYGLLTSTFGWQNRVFTLNNFISLRQIQYPDNSTQNQYGIYHIYNYRGAISNNNIQGFGNGNMNWVGIYAFDIYSGLNNYPIITCNTTADISVGIGFVIPGNSTVFNDNTMDDNTYGLILSDGGNTDTQGNSTYASGNRWVNFTSGNFKTYTMNGSDPNNSTLWIDDNDSDQYPQGAFNGSNTSPSDEYSVGNGLEPVTSNGNTTSCSPPQGLLVYNGGSNQRSGGYSFDDVIIADTSKTVTLFEKLVTDSFPNSRFPDEQAIIAKHRAYMILQLNTDLRNRSNELQNFYSAAHAGNIGKLYKIEEALGTGKLNNADTYLNTIIPANTIEANYKAFYTAYLRMKQGRFTITDSLEINRLVQGCSLRDGIVVYQARALHRLLYKDYKTYFDDCLGSKQQAYKMTETDEKDVITENVMLYPNPSSGEVWFKVEGFHGNQVNVKVFNLEGVLIHQEGINDVTENNKIQFNFSSGVYIVSVNTLERSHNKRVVIVK